MYASEQDIEIVFYRLHERIIYGALRILGKQFIKLVYSVLLIIACALLCTLAYLHVTFVNQKTPGLLSNELQHYYNDFESVYDKSPEVIRLEITKDSNCSSLYYYSAEKGYLILDEQSRQKHNVAQLNITLSELDLELGNEYTKKLINSYVGHDTIIINAMIEMTSLETRGYLYSDVTGELIHINASLRDQSQRTFFFKVGVIITTIFVFFITTTLVHHTLRETQQRMIQFTIDLQLHLSRGLSYNSLIINHIVCSLVFVPIMAGMLFFLFEFFHDQLMAFCVIALVWTCEMYSVLALRTEFSIAIFPKLFLLYFGALHVYTFTYPTGFTHLALFIASTFIIQAMIYFWAKYEIKALLEGDVNEEHIRYVRVRSNVELAQATSYEAAPLSNLIEASEAITGAIGVRRRRNC